MQALGVQIDKDSLEWALMKREGRRLLLVDWGSELCSESVKQLYTKAASIPIVTALSCSDLIVLNYSRSISINAKNLQAFCLQAETKLHFPPNEILTVAVQQAPNCVSTYSTHQAALENHLSICKNAGIDPQRVGASPSSLAAFVRWKAPDVESYFLLDIKHSFSSCVWVHQRAVQKAHDLPYGYNHLKSAYEEDRKKLISLTSSKQMDFTSLKSGQYPHLAEAARVFRREVSKVLHSFHCQEPLILLGELNKNGPFRGFLLEALRDCVTDEIQLDLQPQERLYAASAGHAIDYLTQTKTPIEFRQNRYTSSQVWKKLGQYAFIFLTSSFLLSTSFYFIAHWWLDKREKEIISNLEQWAMTQDPELRFSLFSKGDDLNSLIGQWIRIVDKNAKPYPFLIKAPRAAHFLHWLFTHPFVEKLREEKQPLDFRQIRYRLESYPHLNALEDRYRVKVELEFRTENPLHARQFHEELLQNSEIVDTSREIDWDASENRYKTSFYLKELAYAIF